MTILSSHKRLLLASLLLWARTVLGQATAVSPNIGLQIPGYQAQNWQIPLTWDLYQLDLFLSGNLPLPALNVTGALTAPNIVLPAVNTAPGSYGDSAHCPTFTVDTYGRITSISQSTNCPGGGGGGVSSLTGDVTGSGTGAITTTLATVNMAPGTYGSSTQCVTITVDAKGRVTSASQSTSCPGGGGGTSLLGTIKSETPTGTENGSNTAFTLSQIPSPVGSLNVYRNGARLTGGVDYALSGSALTLTNAPQSGDVLNAWYTYGTGGAGTGNVGAGGVLSAGNIVMGAGTSAVQDSGISINSMVTLSGTQTLTGKSIAASEVNSGVMGLGQLPTATTTTPGIVGVDNSTITVAGGTLRVIGGGSSGTLVGDVTGSVASNTVVKVNGAPIPPSANCVSTNSSSQFQSTNCGTLVAGTQYVGSAQNIAAAATACGTSVGCSVIIPPSYAGGDTIQGLITDPNQPQACNYSSNVLLHDQRGGDTEFGCNYAGYGPFNQTMLHGYWNHTLYNTAPLSQIYSIVTTQLDVFDGGINQQLNASGYGQKTTYGTIGARDLVRTAGQVVNLGLTTEHDGVGDTLGIANYVFCPYAGFFSNADEGCEAHDHQVFMGRNNSWQAYGGIVSGSPGTGATSVSVASVYGGYYQSPGGILLDLGKMTTGAIVTSYYVSNGFTVWSFPASSFPISTAKGSLNVGNNPFVSTVFTPTFTSGSMSAITTGTAVCVVDGGGAEILYPTAVTGTTFTATPNFTHAAGAQFGVGGLCGSYADSVADEVNATNWISQHLQTIYGTIRSPLPIIQSDATHLYLAVLAGGYLSTFTSRIAPNGGVSAIVPHGASSGSNYLVGDLVTIPQSGSGGNAVAKVTSITTIGGVNGIVTSLVLTNYGTNYKSASSISTTGGTGSGLSVDIVGADVNIMPGAMIKSVQLNGGVSNTLTLYPNNVAWASGDSIQEQSGAAPHYTFGNDVVESYVASVGNALQGFGYTLNQPLHDLDVLFHPKMSAPSSFYKQFGGQLTAPFGMDLDGYFTDGIYIPNMPSGVGILFGCNTSIFASASNTTAEGSCNSGIFNVLGVQTAAGQSYIQYNESINTWGINGNPILTSSSGTAPTGIGVPQMEDTNATYLNQSGNLSGITICSPSYCTTGTYLIALPTIIQSLASGTISISVTFADGTGTQTLPILTNVSTATTLSGANPGSLSVPTFTVHMDGSINTTMNVSVSGGAVYSIRPKIIRIGAN